MPVKLFGAGYEGVLRFRRRGAGRKALALLSAAEARQAAGAATLLFGDAVRVNLPWAAAASRL